MTPSSGSEMVEAPRQAEAAAETTSAPPAERGPGPWDRTELIINRPELQRRGQRALHGTLTALAWMVWGYLWLPLITLVAWYFGVRSFITEIVIPDRSTLVLTAIVYFIVIAVLGGSLLLWSRYNLQRFRDRSRRSASPPVTPEETMEWFELSAATLEDFRSAGSLVVEHGDDGEVTAVRDVDPLPEGAGE